MADALYYAGFDIYDITVYNLLNDEIDVNYFSALVVVVGFSYGDVPSAGIGTTSVIMENDKLHKQFMKFRNDENKISLGVCNGCQILSNIDGWIDD